MTHVDSSPGAAWVSSRCAGTAGAAADDDDDSRFFFDLCLRFLLESVDASSLDSDFFFFLRRLRRSSFSSSRALAAARPASPNAGSFSSSEGADGRSDATRAVSAGSGRAPASFLERQDSAGLRVRSAALSLSKRFTWAP